MATQFPKLRSDLIVQRLDEGSRVVFAVSTPDGAVDQRFSERVYFAIHALRGVNDAGSWLAAVRQRDPSLTIGQLQKLLDKVQAMGLLEVTDPRARAPAPPPAAVHYVAPQPEGGGEDDFGERTVVAAVYSDPSVSLEAEPRFVTTPVTAPIAPFQAPPSVPSAPPQSDLDRRYLQAGLEHFRAGALDEAERYLHAALETNPSNAEAGSLLQMVRDAKAGRGPLSRDDMPPVEATNEPVPSEGEEPAGEAVDEGGAAAYEDAALQAESQADATRRRWAWRAKIFGRLVALPAAIIVALAFIPYPLSITYPCAVKPLQQDTVRAPRDGVIAAITVDEGARVTKGQEIGNLHNAATRTAVVKSRAAVEKAKAELQALKEGNRAEEIQAARARVNGLYRELSVAKDRVRRVRGLVKQGIAPRGELETARAQEAAISGQLSQANADLKLVQAGARDDELVKKEAEIKSLQAQLELDEANLEGTVLRSSMDGLVTTLKPRDLVSTRVVAGQPVLEIAVLDEMLAEVLVNERDFDVLKPGLPIEIKVAAYPGAVFQGKVERIAQQVEIIDGQTIIRVEGAIKNQDGLLVPNMTGFAQIEAEEIPILKLLTRRAIRWIRVRFLI